MAKSISIDDLSPTAGYVIVEPAPAETKTASGIYLPENSEDKPQHGQVLAVGDSIIDDGTEVKAPAKKGDQVIYKKWGGNDVKLDDVEYQFLKFEDILAVVKK